MDPVVSSFPSTDRQSVLSLKIWHPEGIPRAIFQISHGMGDCIARYGELAAYLGKAGILVCGVDQVGHGDSISSPDDFGYFPGGKNLSTLVDDQLALMAEMKKTYPHLPYVLFGLSMGSFVVRKAIVSPDFKGDGAIICATSGSAGKPLGFGCFMTSLEASLLGKKHRSGLVSKFSFERYNAHFGNRNRYCWMTRNEEYAAKLCEREETPPFTASGNRQLLGLMREVNTDEWFESVPLSLPVFFISGEDDALGNFGADVKEIVARLEERDFSDLRMKLYPKDRHDLMVEPDKDTVFADILAFTEDCIDGVIAANRIGREEEQ